jgi:hypothetical protein
MTDTPDTAEQLYRERLGRLERERDNAIRNAKGWRGQADRIIAAGRDPGDLEDAIVEAQAEAGRLTAEIVELLDTSRHERERAARQAYGDQTTKLGRSLPSKGREQ